MRFGLSLAALAIALPGPAAAEMLITKPTWERKPTHQELRKSFPYKAIGGLRSQGDAEVKLKCRVLADGAVAGCAVLSIEGDLRTDSPWTKRKLAEAALSLTPYFRMTDTYEGQPVAGAAVIIPILYQTRTVGGR